MKFLSFDTHLLTNLAPISPGLGRQNMKLKIRSRGLWTWFSLQKEVNPYPFHPLWWKKYYLGQLKYFWKKSSPSHNHNHSAFWRNAYKVFNEELVHFANYYNPVTSSPKTLSKHDVGSFIDGIPSPKCNYTRLKSPY